MTKRLVGFFCLMLCMMGTVLLRVLYISTGGISKEAAAMQSKRVMVLAETRAGIFDRNLVPLINKNSERKVLVFPDRLDVSAILEFSDRDELAEAFQKSGPSVIDLEGKIIEGEGIYNFSYPKRYSEETIAPHIIGYLNGGSGVFGTEKSFDGFLKENSKTVSVSYYTDGTGRLLFDEEIVLEEEEVFEKAGVVLSIDSKIQKAAEKALSQNLEKGAIVIMNVQNGEIMASASAPDFEPNDIAAYLEEKNSPFINRAFSAYSVGSTWKIAVAAAAIEKGISTERKYFCSGSTTVDGRVYKCHWESGHGEIDMKRALEISCNPYFIDLALEVGGKDILKLAKDLGFGSAAEFADGFCSGVGNLPTEEELLSKTVLSSFAFGQGSFLATPVQMAVLVSSVANGGKAVVPKLVLGTYDKDGNYYETPQYAKNPVMEAKTAEILKEMMISVVEKGSGENAKPKNGSAGGKTASAQTGQFDENGEEIIHAWFAGFYPAKEPKYAVVVFAEGMNSGGDFAAPVFKDVCEEIELLNYD